MSGNLDQRHEQRKKADAKAKPAPGGRKRTMEQEANRRIKSNCKKMDRQQTHVYKVKQEDGTTKTVFEKVLQYGVIWPSGVPRGL